MTKFTCPWGKQRFFCWLNCVDVGAGGGGGEGVHPGGAQAGDVQAYHVYACGDVQAVGVIRDAVKF